MAYLVKIDSKITATELFAGHDDFGFFAIHMPRTGYSITLSKDELKDLKNAIEEELNS